MQSAAIRLEARAAAWPRQRASAEGDHRLVGGFPCARTGGPLQAFKHDSAYLVLAVSGHLVWEHLGHETVLQAGDAALIDGASGETVERGAGGGCFCLQIPRELVADHFRRPDGSPVRGASAALLGALVRSAFEHADTLGREPSLAVRDALLTLIAACWSAGLVRPIDPLGDDAEPVLMRQVKAYIQDHLDNPALSPPLIARAQGMSVRHLHRLFKAGGVSLGDWVRQRRLAQCAADLADSAHDGESLTAIAFRWGFSDSAHFSRSFRAQYGVAPRAYRAGRKTPPATPRFEGPACS